MFHLMTSAYFLPQPLAPSWKSYRGGGGDVDVWISLLLLCPVSDKKQNKERVWTQNADAAGRSGSVQWFIKQQVTAERV